MKNTIKQECPVPQGILVIIGGKENKGQQPKEDAVDQQNDRSLEISKSFVSVIERDVPVL